MKQVNLKIKNARCPKLRSQIKDAVQIAKRHLMPKMPDLTVEIQIVNGLGFYGLCSDLGEKHYMIEVDNNGDIREMISTVIHEMTHVKQYVRNELQGGLHGVYLWKGQIIHAELENCETPWEQEAYNTETLLIEKVKL